MDLREIVLTLTGWYCLIATGATLYVAQTSGDRIKAAWLHLPLVVYVGLTMWG